MTLMPLGIDSLHYHVLFDVARVGFDGWRKVFAAGACAVLVAFGGFWPQRAAELATYFLRRDVTAPEARALAVGIGGFGVALFSLLAYLDYSQLRDLRTALQRHQYVTVAGRVSHFVQGDSTENIPESFEVGGHRYAFRAGDADAGYRGTFSRPSDIHDGAMLRIADVEGVVARLEIADWSSAASP